MWVPFLGRGDPLERGMATHSSLLAWRIPWTEEPGGLQSTGSQSGTIEGLSTRSSIHHFHIIPCVFLALRTSVSSVHRNFPQTDCKH